MISNLQFFQGTDGLAPTLQKYSQAIAEPLGVNPDRWSFVDFSTIFSMNYVAFITPLPRLEKGDANLSGSMTEILNDLLNPLSFTVWISLSASYFLIMITIWVSFALVESRRGYLFPGSLSIYLLNPLLDQQICRNALTPREHRASFRLVLASWLLTCILVSILYKSSIVSFLIQPKYVQPPTTFRDLFVSNYNISRSSGFPRPILDGFMRDMYLKGFKKGTVFERVTAFEASGNRYGVRRELNLINCEKVIF